jgi:hypothetical protein
VIQTTGDSPSLYPPLAYGLGLTSILQWNQTLSASCVDMTQADDFGAYLDDGGSAQDQDVLFAALMGFSQGIDYSANDMDASDFDPQVC